MKIIKIDPQYKKDLVVIKFMIGNTCNYKCWYCFPGSHEGTHRWPEDLSLIYKNLGHLIDHYKAAGKTKVRLHILGGEPTLWPDLGNFVRYFKINHGCDITMATNGSRTIRWWEEYGEYFDDVIISCHHERIDISHVMNVADILYDKKVMVQAMVLMDPTHWKKCVSIVDQLLDSKKNWYVTTSEVSHYSLKLLTQDQRNYLKNNVKRSPSLMYRLRHQRYHNSEKDSIITTEEKVLKVEKNWLLMNKIRDFKGFTCNIGVDIVFIDIYGTITGSCGNHLYNLDYFFNIYDENFVDKFVVDIVPTTCSKDLCSVCNDELNLLKFKNL